MPQTSDAMEYRVQEYPLCVNGGKVLTDTGWFSVDGEKTSALLDDFGDVREADVTEEIPLWSCAYNGRRMKNILRHRETRRRVGSPLAGVSKALLHSFFW